MKRIAPWAALLVACVQEPQVLFPDGARVADSVLFEAAVEAGVDASVDAALNDTVGDPGDLPDDVARDAECPGAATVCGGRCVDTLSDPRHCGDCDERCPAPSPDCVCGRCVLGCAAGFIGCCRAGAGSGDACFDPMTSNEHCGACGRRCTGGNQCAGGRCEPSLVDCDPRHATCATPPPVCADGERPRVVAACWSGCVALVRCAPAA